MNKKIMTVGLVQLLYTPSLKGLAGPLGSTACIVFFCLWSVIQHHCPVHGDDTVQSSMDLDWQYMVAMKSAQT
jgi:hypothetical protein